MTAPEYNFLDAGNNPVDKLKNIVREDVDGDFGWLKDILDKTLEEYTIKELQVSGPNIGAYNPLQVEIHLAEGARLLDLCLSQRKEIFQLESQAILSALDICLSLQTLELDHKLAQIHLAASASQAQLPPGDGNTSLGTRYDIFRHALRERLKLHNRSGSALNYGERVRFLRKMYVDNLRLAFQRVHAAWRGMAFAFRIKTEDPEAYTPADGNMLDFLVQWMRRAITAVEESDAHERVLDIRIHLVAEGFDNNLKTRLHPSNQDTEGPYHGKFTLKKEHINQYLGDDASNGIPVDTDAIRLLGLDVAFVYGGNDMEWVEYAQEALRKIKNKDQRADYTHLAAYVNEKVRQERELIALKFALTPPLATTELAGDEYYWQPAMMRIENVAAWTEGSARDHFKPTADPRSQNASPFGIWTYSIDGTAKGTSRFTKFGGNPGSALQLAHDGGAKIKNQQFLVQDVVLLLRVAVRKSLHNKP